jgi:hypothetical protein
MRVLERAHSLSNMHQADILPDLKLKHDDHEESPPSPQTEYESRSDSSGPERLMREEERDEPPGARKAPYVGEHHHTPLSPKSRAWYEFDLAVVVALVSPLGQWLTGGDHVKNLLLIFLLIFYLHQIIESECYCRRQDVTHTTDLIQSHGHYTRRRGHERGPRA